MIKIVYTEDKYGERQRAIVFVDGKKITSVSTNSDSSEDNTVSRLGIVESFREVIKTILPEEEIEIETREPEDEDYD